MKARRKVYLGVVVGVGVVYFCLLLILFWSESGDGDAVIRTFGDAFWYSLVTLTTVGYGDLVPVTPLGHMVGMVFLLLSAGIMVTLLGAVVSFIASAVFFAWSAEEEELVLFCGLRGGVGGVGGEYL